MFNIVFINGAFWNNMAIEEQNTVRCSITIEFLIKCKSFPPSTWRDFIAKNLFNSVNFTTSKFKLINLSFVPGSSIERLCDVAASDPTGYAQLDDRGPMVRAARALLGSVTRVLLLADIVVVKQLLLAKDRVSQASRVTWHTNLTCRVSFADIKNVR